MTGEGATTSRWFGAGVLALRGDEVLLTLRAEDEHEPLTWSCFGGMAERGESTRACAVRELREESGIVVREDDLVPVHVHAGPRGFRFHVFAAKVPADATPVASSESRAVGAFRLAAGDPWAGLPPPLHPGMAELAADPAAAAIVAALLRDEGAVDDGARGTTGEGSAGIGGGRRPPVERGDGR